MNSHTSCTLRVVHSAASGSSGASKAGSAGSFFGSHSRCATSPSLSQLQNSSWMLLYSSASSAAMAPAVVGGCPSLAMSLKSSTVIFQSSIDSPA
jgi:hypothetical protein